MNFFVTADKMFVGCTKKLLYIRNEKALRKMLHTCNEAFLFLCTQIEATVQNLEITVE